jgi:ribose-phosphate pyrophosphokinase
MTFAPMIATGTAHEELTETIAAILGLPITNIFCSKFADGETRVEIAENVRGQDVYLIQPTCPPVNDNLMELLVIVDALRRASVGKVTAVIPYFGYARQDRKASPRAPITASLVAHMLSTAGVDHVVTVDVHAIQTQGFFTIPMDNLHAAPVLAQDIRKKHDLENMVVVAPDAGGVMRARSLAKRLKIPLAIIDKRRSDNDNEVVAMNVIGDVENKTCLIIDDMIDTGGTICKAAESLVVDCGAQDVIAYATHGIFSKDALHKIEDSYFKEVVITDTLPTPQGVDLNKKIRIVSVAALIAEAIQRLTNDESITELYEDIPKEALQMLDKSVGIN